MKRETAHRVARTLIAIIPVLLIAQSLSAQQVVSAKAGLVYHIEGDVFLEGKEIKLFVGKYPQLQNGQILRTKQGRAELILGPNIFLRLGENGSLRMEQNLIVDTQLALERGFALIEIVETIKGNRARIRVSNGVMDVSKAGLYRVDANSSEAKVYGGEAMVECSGKKSKVKSGRMVHLDGSSKPSGFDVTMADSFHQWAAKRSFDLFVAASSPSNPRSMYRSIIMVLPAPLKLTHWQSDGVGWLFNSRYRMRFFSEPHYWEWYYNRLRDSPSTPTPSGAPPIERL